MRSDSDFGFDDVFGPVALAGRNVSRQCVSGKRGDGDVVSPADAAFQHATAPGWDILAEAVGLNLASTGVSADTTQFDIDDAASFKLRRGLRVSQLMDGLVEANPGLQLFLKFRMIVDVIPPERLFDHQQIEIVELTQYI